MRHEAYDEDLRRHAAGFFAEGRGRRFVARELGIPEATARQWARAFAVGGEEAVLNVGARRAAFDTETKLAAVREHLERGRSIREVMVKYHITSESTLKAWCRAYAAGGAEALSAGRRGRPPSSSQE